MRPRFSSSESRRGGVLVAALLVVLAVSVLAAGFFQLSTAVTRRQAQSVDSKLAFYMAEAGLAEAFTGLMMGKTGNVGTEKVPAVFGEGLFWVEAEEGNEGQVELRSTGMVGSATATLSLVAAPGMDTVAALGIFSHQPLEIGPGSLLDAYDSSEGTYEEQMGAAAAGTGAALLGAAPGAAMGAGMDSGGGGEEQALHVRLGSNGAIHLTGDESLPTVIKGDVAAGPDAETVVVGQVTIEGSTESSAESQDLPPVEVPEMTVLAGVHHDGAVPLVVPASETGMEYLTVATGSEVIVQGPAVLVTGELALQPGAELTLDAEEGPITVIVTGRLDLASGSILSTPDLDPTRIGILFSGSEVPVQLAALSAFHGVVYAPEAEIDVFPGFAVYGALIGETLNFNGPVQIHFDRFLAELAETSTLPRLHSWRVLEMSTQSRSSPFTLLGVDPAACPCPGAAHKDQALELRYFDDGGTLQQYDGLESAFDWSQVDRVVSGSRDGKKFDSEVGAKSRGKSAEPFMQQGAGTMTPL